MLAGSNIHGVVGCQSGYHTSMDQSYLRVSNFSFFYVGWTHMIINEEGDSLLC